MQQRRCLAGYIRALSCAWCCPGCYTLLHSSYSAFLAWLLLTLGLCGYFRIELDLITSWENTAGTFTDFTGARPTINPQRHAFLF